MPFDLRRAEPTRSSLFGQAIVVPVVLWVVLAVLVTTDAAQGLDDRVADWGYDVGSSSDGMLSFLDGVAIAFSTLPVTGVLLLAALYVVSRGERRLAGWIVVSGTAVLGGNALIKLIFRRDRPVFDEPLHELVSYSFPSGHSSAAAMLATVATLLTIVLTGRGWRRRVLIGLWVLIGLGVGLTRILLGVHYLTDVLAGFCVGVAFTLIAWHVLVPAAARLPHELAVLTGTGRKRFAVVVNPSKVGDLAEFKARVLAVSRSAGWREPLWFETTVEDTGRGQTQAALEADVDLVIAAGGDGTVRAVCEEAARTGIAVGIVPHGTGNLLARNIGIPLNMRDALEVAFGGQDKAIDLATFRTDAVLADPAGETEIGPDPEDDAEEKPVGTDTCFLVMAGLGMDAAIMTGVDDNLKQKVGWFAYFVSGVKALRFPAMRVEISVDDGEFKRFRARTVVIGNVGFLQAGIPLLPDAQIDDGMLDVVVLAPKRFIGWLAIVVRVMGRQRRTNDRLDRLAGKKVVIRAEKPMPMQLDGDPVGDGTEITAEVQQGVLLVRVPVAPAPPTI